MSLNCVVICNTFIYFVHLLLEYKVYILELHKLVIKVSEEDVFNLSAHREVLRSFFLSNTKTSVEQNLCCASAHHDSSMHQWVAVEDASEMAQLVDAKQESMEQIIEEEQDTGHKLLLSHKYSSRQWKGWKHKRRS